MKRILTGIQASGKPHLGNVLGAIKPAIALSNLPEHESFLFIADLHSLTTVKDPKVLSENTRAVAASWLACGFDADKHFFYRQSRLAGYHTELMWYLNCLTPFPMLANAHSFKDKSDQLSDINAGLFTYPVLQAADIVLYQSHLVPVGKDQRQHIEMTRDIAAAFNRTFGEVFVLPEARIEESVMTIPGTDGRKMSKSLNNYIDIFQDEKALNKSIKSIISDSTPLEEPKNPDGDVTFGLYKLVASSADIETMKAKYLAGGYGYGHAKAELHKVLWEVFAAERTLYNYYMTNHEELETKLKAGEEKTEIIAQNTIKHVRAALGFS